MKKIYSYLIIISLFFCVSTFAQQLTIVHYNDTHSHLDPERGGELDQKGGILETVAFLDSLRAVKGARNILLLHAGDFSQGSAYFNVLKGDVEVKLMNIMKYDATTLGNHEFDNGIEEIVRRGKNLKCDIVCANYEFHSKELAKLVKPYTIVRKAGLKIGIIGVLPHLGHLIEPKYFAQMTHLDPIASVNKYAAELKQEKKCDLVICLTHIGIEDERGVMDKDLAAETRNVDLIVGGHSHTYLEDVVYVNNLDSKPVAIVQNACWGLYGTELTVKPMH